jgi:hypothetical protein
LTPIERLALIPGPERLETTTSSEAIGDIAHHPVVDVARFFQSLPDTVALHPAGGLDDRSFSTFRWRWARDGRWIVIGMSLLDGVDELVWGGSPLLCCCQAVDAAALWRSTQQRFPGTWIHDAYDLEVMDGQALIEKWDALR